MNIFNLFKKQTKLPFTELPLNERLRMTESLIGQIHKKESWENIDESIAKILSLPDGLEILMTIREKLLSNSDDWAKTVDKNIYRTLTTCFSRPFLTATPITWDAPASLLEQLMEYEAVHEMETWDDLKQRLGKDRRLYVLFHKALPQLPLAFVEVALTMEISKKIEDILSVGDSSRLDPKKASCAIFYSITNAQKSLRGIPFGEILLHEALFSLKNELPNLENFCTLSPIPSLRNHIERNWESIQKDMDRRLSEKLISLFDPESLKNPTELFLFSNIKTGEQADFISKLLIYLTANYLVTCPDGTPRDPVAKFHLGNGAKLEAVRFQGNTSTRGQEESFCMMANYLYETDKLTLNKAAKLKGKANMGRLASRQCRQP